MIRQDVFSKTVHKMLKDIRERAGRFSDVVEAMQKIFAEGASVDDLEDISEEERAFVKFMLMQPVLAE